VTRHPIETEPKDGSCVLLYAELASDWIDNAMIGWVFGRRDGDENAGVLSPYVPGTRIDFVHGWLPVSVLDTAGAEAIEGSR
jgi:hypothetical protein